MTPSNLHQNTPKVNLPSRTYKELALACLGDEVTGLRGTGVCDAIDAIADGLRDFSFLLYENCGEKHRIEEHIARLDALSDLVRLDRADEEAERVEDKIADVDAELDDNEMERDALERKANKYHAELSELDRVTPVEPEGGELDYAVARKIAINIATHAALEKGINEYYAEAARLTKEKKVLLDELYPGVLSKRGVA